MSRHHSRIATWAPADPGGLPSAAGLAAHLADVNTPVEARSVALVHMLVSDAGSPLYCHGQPARDDLQRRLTQILFEVERGV